MSKESLKLALEALESERDKYLEWGDEDGAPDDVYEAITAIKEALAAPVQSGLDADCIASVVSQRYTAPPTAQRQWVGLTDEKISDIAINNPPTVHEFARAIEAELKEKNT